MRAGLDMNPWVIVGFLVAVAFAGASGYGKGRVDGKASIQAQWDDANSKAAVASEDERIRNQSAINKLAAADATNKRLQAAVNRSLSEQVEKNVPTTLPLLPGCFRVQHDADALGEKADCDPGRVDAAPVAPRDVAKTVSGNYAGARSDKELIANLQRAMDVSGCFDLAK
jgi:hypothetical protein